MDHFCRILPGAKSLKKRQLSGDDARGDISCHAEAYLEALWPVDYRTLTAINSPVLEDFYIKCGLSESHFDQSFRLSLSHSAISLVNDSVVLYMRYLVH